MPPRASAAKKRVAAKKMSDEDEMAMLDRLIAENRQLAAAARQQQVRERVGAAIVPLNGPHFVPAAQTAGAVQDETEVAASPLDAASMLFGGTGRPKRDGPPLDPVKVDAVFAHLQRYAQDAGDNDSDSTPDAWVDTDESDSSSADDADDLRVAETPMPDVSERSMDDVFGGGGAPGQKSFLARVMDPDGGKNRTGLEGLLATERPTDPRERLRQRRRALEKQRSGMTEDDYMYDKRGRRIRGARKVTMDEVKMGLVPPSQKSSVDRNMTKQQIRRNVADLRNNPALQEALGEA